MKIQVILVDEQNGKWGWKTKGDGFNSGGNGTADTKTEAEQQAKQFIQMLIKKEIVNLETDSILINEGKRI